ncbi:MAG: hypothetical protein RIM80_12760 [Alphaproteobacteria bacterium]
MAERETITFNSAANKITLTFDDASTIDYVEADKAQYLLDWPDRAADVVAMGWDA